MPAKKKKKQHHDQQWPDYGSRYVEVATSEVYTSTAAKRKKEESKKKKTRRNINLEGATSHFRFLCSGND